MAKARKSESGAATGGKKKAAAKKTPAKAAKAKPPTPAISPMIDTNLAAETAARMLAAKFSKPAAGANAPRQESAMFKQLKAGLNASHATAMSNVLDKSHGPDPARTHPQMKQVGRNQTFGADVTRSGVPRRTPG